MTWADEWRDATEVQRREWTRGRLDRPIEAPTSVESARRWAEHERLVAASDALCALDKTIDDPKTPDAKVPELLAHRERLVAELGELYDPDEHSRKAMLPDGRMVDGREWRKVHG